MNCNKLVKEALEGIQSKGSGAPIESLNTKKVQDYIGDRKGVDNSELDEALKKTEGDYVGPAIRGEVNPTLARLQVGDSYTTQKVTSIAKEKNTADLFASREFQGRQGPKVFITFDKFKNKPVNLGAGNKLGFDDVAQPPKAGSKGSYIEDEVVIPSGRNFKIVKKETSHGEIHLMVEEQ